MTSSVYGTISTIPNTLCQSVVNDTFFRNDGDCAYVVATENVYLLYQNSSGCSALNRYVLDILPHNYALL